MQANPTPISPFDID
jgi:hypothetical protein